MTDKISVLLEAIGVGREVADHGADGRRIDRGDELGMDEAELLALDGEGAEAPLFVSNVRAKSPLSFGAAASPEGGLEVLLLAFRVSRRYAAQRSRPGSRRRRWACHARPRRRGARAATGCRP